LAGVLVAVAGGLLLAQARMSQFGWTSYAPVLGWTAYGPDRDRFSTPGLVVFDQRQAFVGLLLLLVGVALMGVGLGVGIAGRRSGGLPTQMAADVSTDPSQ
jgi:hypothetical protein